MNMLNAVVLFGFLAYANAQRNGSDCEDLTLSATPEVQILTEGNPGSNGCQARITSPSGTNIKITAIEANCDGDPKELEFYVPGDTRAKLKLCRSQSTTSGAAWTLPLTFLTDNELFVYETQPDLTFRIEYSYVPVVENICNVNGPITVGDNPRYLTSPNFEIGPYLNNEECTVTVKGTDECRIGLRINSSLETGEDWIRVCPDVPVGNPACTTFGNEEFTINDFTAVNEAIVTFHSDVYGSWYGFSMQLTCTPAFSDWDNWAVVGCRRRPNNHGGFLFVREEKRHRNCLIPPCNEEDLVQTVLTPCSSRCTHKCCRTPTVQH